MRSNLILFLILLFSSCSNQNPIDETRLKKGLNIEIEKSDTSRFIYYSVNPADSVVITYKDSTGERFANAKTLNQYFDETPQFICNGGMYLKDGSPQGLCIIDGVLIKPINTVQKAYGNFYLQPNGIFSISKSGEFSVTQTSEFNFTKDINYATQSGPMLLIDGNYHTSLIEGSTNLHIRNGVGVTAKGELIFAQSKQETNFYDLATFFKEKGCVNALYLDGFVSRSYYKNKNWKQLDGDFGPMIVVF